MVKLVKSVNVNFVKVWMISISLSLIVWLIPLLTGKYVDITFPYIPQQDIPQELVGHTGISESKNVDWCPVISPLLHDSVRLMSSNVEVLPEEEIAKKSNIQKGGVSQPENCRSRYEVVIILPYRNRSTHLQQFLTYMHPFLTKQQLHYRIVVVEQFGEAPFNRAKLFNIGYKETLKLDQADQIDCVIFHDVDLLPRNDKNIYACTHNPRHMYSALDTFRYHLPYRGLAGGAVAFLRSQFEAIDGFSNRFTGWGGEDDDLRSRIHSHGLDMVRFDPVVASYIMLTHKSETPAHNRYTIMKENSKKVLKDGLSTLKYKLMEKQEKPLYTWLLVSC